MGRYNLLLAFGGAAAIFAAVGSYTHDVPVSLFDDHVITRLIFGIVGVTALRQSGEPDVTGPQRWNVPVDPPTLPPIPGLILISLGLQLQSIW